MHLAESWEIFSLQSPGEKKILPVPVFLLIYAVYCGTEGVYRLEASDSHIRKFLPILQILLRSIVPVAGSAAIGFVFFRGMVFNPHYPTFEFISTAALASVFFYSLLYLQRRDAYGVLFILFLLVLLVTGSTRPMWVLRDIIDTGGVAFAVLLYARIYRMTPQLPQHYFGLVFSGILGTFNIASWSLQFFFVQYLFRAHQPIHYLNLVYIAGFDGFLTGLGVGIGILINQRIFGIVRHTQMGDSSVQHG